MSSSDDDRRNGLKHFLVGDDYDEIEERNRNKYLRRSSRNKSKNEKPIGTRKRYRDDDDSENDNILSDSDDGFGPRRSRRHNRVKKYNESDSDENLDDKKFVDDGGGEWKRIDEEEELEEEIYSSHSDASDSVAPTETSITLKKKVRKKKLVVESDEDDDEDVPYDDEENEEEEVPCDESEEESEMMDSVENKTGESDVIPKTEKDGTINCKKEPVDEGVDSSCHESNEQNLHISDITQSVELDSFVQSPKHSESVKNPSDVTQPNDSTSRKNVHQSMDVTVPNNTASPKNLHLSNITQPKTIPHSPHSDNIHQNNVKIEERLEENVEYKNYSASIGADHAPMETSCNKQTLSSDFQAPVQIHHPKPIHPRDMIRSKMGNQLVSDNIPMSSSNGQTNIQNRPVFDSQHVWQDKPLVSLAGNQMSHKPEVSFAGNQMSHEEMMSGFQTSNVTSPSQYFPNKYPQSVQSPEYRMHMPHSMYSPRAYSIPPASSYSYSGGSPRNPPPPPYSNQHWSGLPGHRMRPPPPEYYQRLHEAQAVPTNKFYASQQRWHMDQNEQNSAVTWASSQHNVDSPPYNPSREYKKSKDQAKQEREMKKIEQMKEKERKQNQRNYSPPAFQPPQARSMNFFKNMVISPDASNDQNQTASGFAPFSPTRI